MDLVKAESTRVRYARSGSLDAQEAEAPATSLEEDCLESNTPGGLGASTSSLSVRVLVIDRLDDCTGVTATDTLGVFVWSCEPATAGDVVYSERLRDTQGASTLVDFTAGSWLDNEVIVLRGEHRAAVGHSDSPWWSNAVIIDNDGGFLTQEGAIVLVNTGYTTGEYWFGADGVALLVQEGSTLSAARGDGAVVHTAEDNFVWFEGAIEASGNRYGLYVDDTSFSTFRRVRVQNQDYEDAGFGACIRIGDSTNNRLTNLSIANCAPLVCG